MADGEVPDCTGTCCAAFHLTHELDEVRRGRAADGKRVPPDEARKIADMLIPLGPDEVREATGDDERADEDIDDRWFTCRHWDRETRLCTIYPDRPQMCRDYGTEKVPCSHGCGGGCPASVQQSES